MIKLQKRKEELKSCGVFFKVQEQRRRKKNKKTKKKNKKRTKMHPLRGLTYINTINLNLLKFNTFERTSILILSFQEKCIRPTLESGC